MPDTDHTIDHIAQEIWSYARDGVSVMDSETAVRRIAEGIEKACSETQELLDETRREVERQKRTIARLRQGIRSWHERCPECHAGEGDTHGIECDLVELLGGAKTWHQRKSVGVAETAGE